MAAHQAETGGGGARSEKPAPEQREVDVVDAGNKKVGSLDLEPRIFGVPVNDHLIYEAVKQYRASGRAGTHKTKTRGLVSGTGKKPWRQKGTGRARVGESRIPLWRHGGTVFGPQPRDYSYSMPKKARAAALRSALSQRTADGSLRIVDVLPEIQPADGKKPGLTRQLAAFLKGLELTGQKTLIVESEPSDMLILSARNIPGVRVLDPSALSVYDVLDCRTVLVSRQAVGRIEERLLR